MATANDIVAAALRDIGVLAAGETASAEDAADALAALNRLVDQWSAERLQIYTTARTTWTLVPGTQNYTVGTGGTVNVPRPVHLDYVRFMDTSTDPDTEYPLHELTNDAYAALPQKSLAGTLPASWFYAPTFPTGTLSLFPVPTSSTLQGVLYAPRAVAQFAALSDAVAVPPGYERMLVKNLSVELLPSYGRQPDPLLLEQARDAKAVVKRANSQPADQSFEGPFVGGAGWSIYTGS